MRFTKKSLMIYLTSVIIMLIVMAFTFSGVDLYHSLLIR
ncbi:preprotein translocase subunit SecE [Aeromonas hydrophila]